MPYHQLGPALREYAEELDLHDETASRLPLGLFVLGETDQRPGAFGAEEMETQARCWIPEILLMQDGNSVLVFGADESLRLDIVRRLTEVQDDEPGLLTRLGLPGYRTRLKETVVDTP